MSPTSPGTGPARSGSPPERDQSLSLPFTDPTSPNSKEKRQSSQNWPAPAASAATTLYELLSSTTLSGSVCSGWYQTSKNNI